MKRSLIYVIDASVASSAGISGDPQAKACRDVLTAIINICHRIIITKAIVKEWDDHQSSFFKKWRIDMLRKKGTQGKSKIVFDRPPAKVTIVDADFEAGELAAVKKDIHLVEAAIAADRIIISRDYTVRDILNKTPERLELCRGVKWIDPLDGPDVIPPR